jgi:mono/diheme cytochrome c family protein
MKRGFAIVVIVVASALSLACENRQAIEEPEWTLSRMLSQRRASPYRPTSAFADGKVMRDPPTGSIPQDDDRDQPPPPIARELLRLGQDRFNAICAACHGIVGDGNSVVATKMVLRRPPSLHDARYLALSRDQLFVIVTDGYGLMPSYADMLPRSERWAVVAYVQALQLSQAARVADLPQEMRTELAKEAPKK